RLDQAFTELMPALILQDAAAAGRLAAQVADAELRQDVLRLVARLWSAKDPAAAAAWAAALPADVEHDTALSEIASEVASTDAPRAVQLYALYARSAELSPTLETLAHQWADQNFGAALTWTLARPPSAQRESLLARLAFVQARTDPRAAATLATTHLAPGERQDEAVIAVLHQWAQLDPSAAASWVAAFPAGPLRDRASTELAGVSAYRVTRRPP
ncbi:MAG TPA: hypothetical protein VEQ65_12990, partial [Opitutus sp.]|nr:hypothetical protein [Opitutus sp.]